MHYRTEYQPDDMAQPIEVGYHRTRQSAEASARRISEKRRMTVYVISSDGDDTGHKAYYLGCVDHTEGAYQ